MIPTELASRIPVLNPSELRGNSISTQPGSISARMPVQIRALPPAGTTVSAGATKSYPALPAVARRGRGISSSGSASAARSPMASAHWEAETCPNFATVIPTPLSPTSDHLKTNN